MKTNLTIIILLSILPLTICCEGEKGDDDTNDRTIRLNAGLPPFIQKPPSRKVLLMRRLPDGNPHHPPPTTRVPRHG